ncbi:MAG: iron-sulfur cluster assembly scaffold protein [Deltaproteobacteria bacterium]|jgi:nitrogen fixation NifU-like protein|nr:iron-sulfur cluster assembly scaffold protein [Deltaproteobacteria bacterium]
MVAKEFDFWQDHSLRYLEMAFRNDRRAVIAHPDGYGKRTGRCADTVEIYLTVRDGRIRSVAYQTDGCMNTNACANAAAELIEDRDIETAWELTPEDVIDYLETLPVEHFHCAELSVGALYRALRNYQDNQRAPWKKLYPCK